MKIESYKNLLYNLTFPRLPFIANHDYVEKFRTCEIRESALFVYKIVQDWLVCRLKEILYSL
jgi:hypothetical protein